MVNEPLYQKEWWWYQADTTLLTTVHWCFHAHVAWKTSYRTSCRLNFHITPTRNRRDQHQPERAPRSLWASIPNLNSWRWLQLHGPLDFYPTNQNSQKGFQKATFTITCFKRKFYPSLNGRNLATLAIWTQSKTKLTWWAAIQLVFRQCSAQPKSISNPMQNSNIR